MDIRYARRSEDTEQVLVMQWAALNERRYPELKWLFHVPNGGSRNRAEAVKLKQMGVKAGVSDLHLPAGKGMYGGLCIEMKYADGTIQKNQKEFLKDMAAAGKYACVCYGADEVIQVLEDYLKLNPGQAVGTENPCIRKNGKIQRI